MFKKIRLTRTVQQDLEDFLDSGGKLELLDNKVVNSMVKKHDIF